MNVKLLILVATLIQGHRAETIQEVIADLTPKIITVKTKIDTAIQDGGQLIRRARATIGQTITDGETTVQDQLDQVDDIVAQAEQEAQEKGGDVSKCVSEVTEAVAEVDFGKLQECANNPELNLIGMEFGNLRIVKKSLATAIQRCLSANPQDAPALRTCVQSEINSAEVKVTDIQNRLTKICEEAPGKASICVEEEVNELDKIITSAAHNLKNCLQQTL